jgi:hypothetical protein
LGRLAELGLLGVEGMYILESVLVPLIVGLATGVISSHYVARRFYRKALLDDCSRLLRRLCPYRRSNVREGDGLDETSWALKIQSEIMQRLFPREARQIAGLSAEIGSAPEIDSSKDDPRQARDRLKEEVWKKRVTDLY